MPVPEQRIRDQLPVSSHRVTKDRPLTWPQVRLQSPLEMWRAVGRILWKTAEIYMAAFAGMVGGFIVGVLLSLLLMSLYWFGLEILLLPLFTTAAGGLLLAFLAWKEQT